MLIVLHFNVSKMSNAACLLVKEYFLLCGTVLVSAESFNMFSEEFTVGCVCRINTSVTAPHGGRNTEEINTPSLHRVRSLGFTGSFF